MFNIFLLFCIPFAIMGYIVFVWQWKKNPQNFYPKERPLIFGHRGSPRHITENTLTSFEKAIDQFDKAIKIDSTHSFSYLSLAQIYEGLKLIYS